MIGRWADFIRIAYRPAFQLPLMLSWSFGLTALFACVTDQVLRWRPGTELLITAFTLVLSMLLMRALDDIRDLDYDRQVNPHRPLPSGLVSERDLLVLVGLGCALLLLVNLDRGVALVMLIVEMAYTATVIAADRLAGWPAPDRLGLQLALNLPIQTLLSLYVYLAFLRADRLRPSAVGLWMIAAVTLAALCLEFGRKTTRRLKAGERSYVSVLGPSVTSLVALTAAVLASVIVLIGLTPWRGGSGWGWLVLLPLALPARAATRFAGGADRWPVLPTLAYLPAMYTSYLAVGGLTKWTA